VVKAANSNHNDGRACQAARYDGFSSTGVEKARIRLCLFDIVCGRCFLDNKVLLPFSRIVSHSYGFRHERRQGIMVAMPVRYDYERRDWTEKTVTKAWRLFE
jgi:hypothetical protein